MKDQCYVEVYRRSDGHVEQRMGPMPRDRATRVQDGVRINLNHEEWGTRLTDDA